MRKKFLHCFLLGMLCAFLVACDSTVEPEPPVTTAASLSETTLPQELPDVPLHADYEKYEFRVLSAGNQAFNDFNYQEESSLPLDNAQYKRKVKVEEDYNIVIKENITKGSSTGSGPGYKAVSRQVNSGDYDYNLCLIAAYDVSVLAYNGWLYDMQSLDSINLEKSWWDQNATESLAVKDVVFFTTGDITVSDNRMAYCILFNKELLNSYGLQSPYELVEENEWTIENLGKLCKSVSEDLNQDGLYTEADRYGLLVWDDSIRGIINAAGQRCCTIEEDGSIALTLYNETTVDALAQYTQIAYDKQYAFTYQRYVNSALDLWQNDQALFWTTVVDKLPSLREMESDFGILPYPKLQETQERYYNSISAYGAQFICMPLSQEDAERTGAITELLAYYGQKIVTPALYDVTLIGQSTRDEESEPMLDIIFDSLVYDIGFYYQVGSYNTNLVYMLRDFDTNFTSMYNRYNAAAELKLKMINTYYNEAVSEWQK